MIGAVLAVSAGAAGEPAPGAGPAAFEPCRSCHSLEPDAGAMAGPDLFGLIGRPVAGDPDYDYSPVLRAARERGLVWDRALLERFLADPEGMFPGMWMSYPGVADAGERSALAAYIAAGASGKNR